MDTSHGEILGVCSFSVTVLRDSRLYRLPEAAVEGNRLHERRRCQAVLRNSAGVSGCAMQNGSAHTPAHRHSTVKGVGLVEKDPKTESSKRVISISDKLVAVLMEYKEWYDQYKYDVGDRWHETNRLFISEDGKVMYPGTISYWVHKICDQAGLPHRTVLSLRHTNITTQIAAGVPLAGNGSRPSRPCANEHYDGHLQPLPKELR